MTIFGTVACVWRGNVRRQKPRTPHCCSHLNGVRPTSDAGAMTRWPIHQYVGAVGTCMTKGHLVIYLRARGWVGARTIGHTMSSSWPCLPRLRYAHVPGACRGCALAPTLALTRA